MTVPSRVPSSVLYQIEQELGEDEKEMLGFMCRDVAPDLPTQDLRALLDALNNLGLLSPHGLSELVYRVRRFDLLKRTLKTQKVDVEAHLKKQQLVPDYRVLMLDINEELGTDDVKSLVFLLRDYVGHGRLEKAKTFLAIAVELEKVNLLAPHKMDLLEKCLLNIKRMDLKNRIQKYKQTGEASARCPQPVYINALQASLPNLRLTDPLHIPQLRRSETPRTANERTFSQAAEKVHISVQESGASLCQGPDDRYKMQSRPLGICLIIDCIGNDGEELKETFTTLNFEVMCYLYLSMEDLIQTVQKVAGMPKHRDVDSFVCVLISRGSPQSVFGIDQCFPGFALDQMKNLFTGESCPGLLGKPKLFFIQNYVAHESPEETSSLLEVDGNERIFNGGNVARWRSCGIPNEADIFWSHCKVDSSMLQKASSSPSYYLFCLSQLLRDHQKRRLHLLDIHTELNRRVYERNATSDPRDHYSLMLQHTLRKKLFLTCS